MCRCECWSWRITLRWPTGSARACATPVSPLTWSTTARQPWKAQQYRLRRGRARPRPAGRARRPGLPPAGARRLAQPHPDADRGRGRRGSGRRAGAGRRRLPRQAVRLRRADRAHPRPGATRTRLARGRAARRPGGRSRPAPRQPRRHPAAPHPQGVRRAGMPGRRGRRRGQRRGAARPRVGRARRPVQQHGRGDRRAAAPQTRRPAADRDRRRRRLPAVRRHLSARSRLTLLYTSLFALGGAALVLITYLLVAHTLHSTTTTTTEQQIRQAIDQCVTAAQQAGSDSAARAKQKCTDLYANGVRAGAAAQRSTTLTHLLTYSLLSLAGVTLLAAVAGWIVAGRILRPVRRLTAAARAASEQNLSQRIALQGPRDELRELADTFDTMLERLDRAFTSQRQFIANASHELRTPLTLMRTATDVVLAKPQPTRDELVSMAAEVRQAVDHAERLIEALLVLARNEQARALTDPLDLAAVAEDALEGRTADGITTTATLDQAPVTGDG